MTTVFVGGSRKITKLPNSFQKRLNTIIDNGFDVIVGDANGADKALQKFFKSSKYDKVKVYCTGNEARNNEGGWKVVNVQPPQNAKGFAFFAEKDREMASVADYGLMLWDNKSSGTILNILRLIRNNKKAVLCFEIPENDITIKNEIDWNNLISRCDPLVIKEMKDRATFDEWHGKQITQNELAFDYHEDTANDETLTASINSALKSGDGAAVLAALGQLAKKRGMTHVARNTGLSREGLYRSLREDGNPEFSSVIRVMQSMGLKISVTS